METITTSFYGNCSCLAPTGEILFRCDQRKMGWYLEKQLATQVDELTFQLKFEPQGSGHQGDPFFLQERENRCVVCGTEEKLTRHHIVPYCYRKFFPKVLIPYGPYDVMMLCLTHHKAYEVFAKAFRKELSNEYDVAFTAEIISYPHDNPTQFRAISAAFALVRYSKQMPEKRQEQLRTWIRKYLQKDEIYEADLDMLMQLGKNTKTVSIPHGKLIMDAVTDLDVFMCRWRRHFIEKMNPQFLPKHWDPERKLLETCS